MYKLYVPPEKQEEIEKVYREYEDHPLAKIIFREFSRVCDRKSTIPLQWLRLAEQSTTGSENLLLKAYLNTNEYPAVKLLKDYSGEALKKALLDFNTPNQLIAHVLHNYKKFTIETLLYLAKTSGLINSCPETWAEDLTSSFGAQMRLVAKQKMIIEIEVEYELDTPCNFQIPTEFLYNQLGKDKSPSVRIRNLLEGLKNRFNVSSPSEILQRISPKENEKTSNKSKMLNLIKTKTLEMFIPTGTTVKIDDNTRVTFRSSPKGLSEAPIELDVLPITRRSMIPQVILSGAYPNFNLGDLTLEEAKKRWRLPTHGPRGEIVIETAYSSSSPGERIRTPLETQQEEHYATPKLDGVIDALSYYLVPAQVEEYLINLKKEEKIGIPLEKKKKKAAQVLR